MSQEQHFIEVSDQLSELCHQLGRRPEEVTLIAVSKAVSDTAVTSALEAGAVNFGENRADQLCARADTYPEARWHFIGNIQSRRIKDIAGKAHLVHSLCTEKHARKFNEIAQAGDFIQDVLLEVNVSGEESKQGLNPDELFRLAQICCELDYINLRGLMTMAPKDDDDTARRSFAGLYELREALRCDFSSVQELSMGMSDDWRIAISEGATMVRIGRAIFPGGSAR